MGTDQLFPEREDTYVRAGYAESDCFEAIDTYSDAWRISFEEFYIDHACAYTGKWEWHNDGI